LSKHEWDVVLLDWWLPKTDGLSLLRRFRHANRSTPVLFLTARDAVPERVVGLNSGADDYLCKPFAFEELLARVRAMERRQERSPTSLSWGDLTVDLTNRRAERAGHRIYLTAREESLLVFMMRHPGEVLTRRQLYEQVWDDRYDGLSNTLEVHVMELRKKLEAHGPRLIQTLRNRGYSFGEEIG
jgi:two-component system, OmpR family, copper resistance phosphate regulon response regulator CusR